MKKLTHYISDGYEEDGYIAELPGLFPALRFKYRPMLVEARDTLAQALSSRRPSESHKALSAAMASRIVNWDASDATGKPLPIEPVTFQHLRPRLFDRLYAIVCGDSASDIDPKAAPQAQNAEAEAALQAAIEGRPVSEVKREADEKN